MSNLLTKDLNNKAIVFNKSEIKKQFLKFEQEADILNRIEKVRQELNKMINNKNGILLDDEIIEISQYLDRLLTLHVRNIESKKDDREEKNYKLEFEGGK